VGEASLGTYRQVSGDFVVRVICVCVSVSLIVSASGAVADALPDARVRPGMTIHAGDAELLRGLIPEELAPFTIEKFPQLEMQIVETASYPVHPKYREATERFACKARIGEKRELADHVAGEPFPYSEWAKEATRHACDLKPDDPDAGLKIAWNFDQRWNGGGVDMPHTGQSFWRAKGDNTWKIGQGQYRRTYFSYRADLLPETTDLVPDTNVFFAEYSETFDPFDLRGNSFLIYRYRDSHVREDDAWAYVPTLRRVKRISASQKADSVQGTDFTYEDFYLFSGYVWDHDWKLLGDEEVVAPMDSDRKCFPLNVPGWKPDEFGELGTREQFEECAFGPYRALPFVGEKWQKRTAIKLEQRPHRQGHPYSRRILWIDKETYSPLMAISYDQAGKPFRIGWYIGRWSENSGIAGDSGRFVNHHAASMVVNLRDNVSNLFLFFSANSRPIDAAATQSYFDTTRLKGGR